jgi:hypothetical protein
MQREAEFAGAPLGLGSAGRLAKHLRGSGGAKLLHLRVNALPSVKTLA